MLQAVFERFLVVSIAGTGGALCLAALRLAFRRTLSARWKYYAWLPLLALLVLAPLVPHLAEETPAPLQTAVEWVAPLTPDEAAPRAASLPERNAPSGIRFRLSGFLPYIWLAGVLLSLLWAGFGYARTLRFLRRTASPPADPEIRRSFDRCRSELGLRQKVRLLDSPVLPSPLLAGVLRPTVYLNGLPASETELSCILLHELTHCKRRDLLYKWLAVLVRALYWFHPLVYWMQRDLNHWCELSCDQAVVRNWDSPRRRNYMQTILSLLERTVECRPLPLTTSMCARRRIEQRLLLICDRKPRPLRVRAAAAALAFCFSAAMLGTGLIARALLREPLESAAAPAAASASHTAPLPTPVQPSAPPAAQADFPQPDAESRAAIPQEQPAPAPPADGAAASAPPRPATPADTAEEPQAAEPSPILPAVKPADSGSSESTGYYMEEWRNWDYIPMPAGARLEDVAASVEQTQQKSDGGALCKLESQYALASYALGPDSRQLLSDVTPDQNGRITLFFQSEFADPVSIQIVEKETRVLMRSLQVRDTTAANSCYGLDPQTVYEVLACNPGGDDYTLTGTALIY